MSENKLTAVLPAVISNSRDPLVLNSDIPFELELLSMAKNYQEWILRTVRPFLGNRILEIGSGIGNMSLLLPVRDRLILSEADPKLIPILHQQVTHRFRHDSRVLVKKIDLGSDWKSELAAENVDTIVSFNVFEHIEDDSKAFSDCIDILSNSKSQGIKRLVTFVPAHHWAYGSIDRKYGHFRRYSRKDFKELLKKHAPGAALYQRHFNLVGLPSWLLMGRVLKKKEIGINAVQTFERICPWIRGIDDLLHKTLHLPLGQSLLAVVSWDGTKGRPSQITLNSKHAASGAHSETFL